jgi:phosphoribosylamine--glycine ligase
VLLDGHGYRLLATARDHKRIFDGDEGPNTGGMGAVSPANNWNTALETEFDQQIMEPLLRVLEKKGVQFRGLLFPGLIITADGPRVLEFNCRFGDPETQAILPRMKSNLVPLLEATIDGNVAGKDIIWDDRTAVTVVLASAGYPGKYETGRPITGLNEATQLEDVQIFHAGTRQVKDQIVTSGGRVLSVTALGATLEGARAQAYKAVSCIHFDGCHYRRDIALTKAAG